MKTCKTGCGKMKAGGSIKKLAKGGQALNKAKGFAKPQTGGDNVSKNIFGVPNAGPTGPNRTGTYDYKKGGSIKKLAKAQKGYVSGASGDAPLGSSPFRTSGSKLAVGSIVAGGLASGIKTISDKVKAKKAAKKAADEKKKNESASKAKFGASVPVKESCKHGMVRGADGKCVMSRPKFKSGGFPDLNKDGKITKADILKGRGVIKKMGGAKRK